MHDPLEHAVTRLAVALRSLARDARLPRTIAEHPVERLAHVANRLDAAASDLEGALAVILQARQRESR